MIALTGLTCILVGFALGFMFRGCFETIKPNLDNALMARLMRFIDRVQKQADGKRTRSRRSDVPDMDSEEVKSRSPFSDVYESTNEGQV
ncbi:MAG: hypothetical protein RTU09_10425 [Candidatus Thorarchaeota archaeon]